MLVARAQLELVRGFVAEFSRSTGELWPVTLIRAQYVAMVVTLRSVGNVLRDGDAFGPTAVVVDGSIPGQVSLLVAFDAGARTIGGRPTLALLGEAVDFWEDRVSQAERAFAAMS